MNLPNSMENDKHYEYLDKINKLEEDVEPPEVNDILEKDDESPTDST